MELFDHSADVSVSSNVYISVQCGDEGMSEDVGWLRMIVLCCVKSLLMFSRRTEPVGHVEHVLADLDLLTCLGGHKLVPGGVEHCCAHCCAHCCPHCCAHLLSSLCSLLCSLL